MVSKKPARSATLGDVGELGWLERVAGVLRASTASASVMAGFGDDAACLAVGHDSKAVLLVTTDVLCEFVHFTWRTATPASLGEKAVAVNLSDIAAMGGRPTAMVVGCAAPPEYSVARLEAVACSMARVCRRWNVDFVGGDTVRNGCHLVLSVTLLGEFDGPAERLPLRGRMRAGQRLYVTGTLGDSGGGLGLLNGIDPTKPKRPRSGKQAPWRKFLIDRHRRPTPRVDEGRALVHALDDLAMIDLSDDLAKSVGLLAEASGVGAAIRLDCLPISSALKRYARVLESDPVDWAVDSGEDFELLFATAADLRTVRTIFRRAGIQTPVTEIGRAGGRGVRWLNAAGRKVPPRWKPFEHFE